MSAQAWGHDPLGAEAPPGSLGFISGRARSEESLAWSARWSRFPIYAQKRVLTALHESFRQNAVTLVISGTGSGKTVLVPPLVLKALGAGGKRVVVTIPKRVTAKQAASTAALTLDVQVGKEVGYRYRGAPSGAMDARTTRLLFSTDGALLAQVRREPRLADVGAVVLDEAHERPVPTDMLLQALRDDVRPARAKAGIEPMRIIIMSATIDPAAFKSYFEAAGCRVGVVEVPGEQTLHPVKHNYLTKDLPPGVYLDEAQKVVRQLFQPQPKAGPEGDVLVFVVTTREAASACTDFKAACGKGRGYTDAPDCQHALCVGLSGRSGPDETDAALQPPPRDKRKVVFATNVAESSVTIKGLTHVVDPGLQLRSVWLAGQHGAMVTRGFASRAQLLQRIGRVGRTAPGVVHHLYTKKLYESLPMYPTPSVLDTDMTEHILQDLRPEAAGGGLTAALKRFEQLLTPPTREQLVGAVSFLHFYRLIHVRRSDDGAPLAFMQVPYSSMLRKDAPPVHEVLSGELSSHGWARMVMERARISLASALLVCAGVVYGCWREATTLAAMFEVMQALGVPMGSDLALWWPPPGARRDGSAAKGAAARMVGGARDAKARANDARSDHQALLNVYWGVCAPAMQVARKEAQSVSDALKAAGLSPRLWGAVHKKVQETIQVVSKLSTNASDRGIVKQVKAECPLYALDGCPLTPVERALLAARMYHACVPEKGRRSVTTIAPPVRSARCTVETISAARNPPSGCPLGLYEQLSLDESKQGGRLGTVTWLSWLPAGIRP